MPTIRCLARSCANWTSTSECARREAVLGPRGMCADFRETVSIAPRPSRAVISERSRESVTYRLEMVSCGKCAKCKAHGPSHGPYWYAYWKERGRTRSRYLGRGKVISGGGAGEGDGGQWAAAGEAASDDVIVTGSDERRDETVVVPDSWPEGPAESDRQTRTRPGRRTGERGAGKARSGGAAAEGG